MIKNMYGSIHTHFEDSFDAVNNITDAVLEFILQGAVQVAATGHGVFTEYEDIRDTILEARAKSEEVKTALKDAGISISFQTEDDGRIIPLLQGQASDSQIRQFIKSIGISGHLAQEDKNEIIKNPYLAACYISMVSQFNVIPGIEAYFGEDRSHMILIATDYAGYQSLSRIITQAAHNYDGVPVVTLDNLQKYVNKGHVICTSACIAGVFGKRLALNEINLRDKVKKAESKLTEMKYYDATASIERQTYLKSIKKPTKAQETAANRLIKKENDYSLREEWDEHMRSFQIAQEELNASEDKFAWAKQVLKACSRTYNSFLSYQEELLNIESNREQEYDNLKSLYYSLEDIFGKENFYFEIQNHGLDKEKIIYNKIINFAEDVGNPNFVASNDIHICKTKGTTKEEEQEYQDALLKRNIAKFGRFNKYEDPTPDDAEYIIKNDNELANELLKIISGTDMLSKEKIISTAVLNIRNILERCHVEFPKNEEHYPKFCDDENQMFDDLVEIGAKRLFPDGLPQGYRERIDREKDVIKQMGYAGYHLIVQDYLAYGRLLGYLTEEEIENAPLSVPELEKYVDRLHPEGRLGISIGPGRGSAGGSICCFLLGITDVDPMKYGLLFERFLNVERVSMPDIDSDFRPDVRGKTYEYCMKKYGEDKVCKVLTKTYLSDKGTVRKAGSYLGSKYTKDDENAIKELPIKYYQLTDKELKEKRKQLDAQIDKTKHDYLNASSAICEKYVEISKNPELSSDEIFTRISREMKNNKEAQEIIELAKKIDGMFTVYGKHAAGVVISKDPLQDIIPIMYDEKDAVFKTQCVPTQAENKGLLKMDFLGLKNLSIITNVIRTQGKEDYTLQTQEGIAKILANKEIYKTIFATGFTQGIFQFESIGMKRMLKEFKPESFEDIVLLVAAYRPGPMDYIPEIIAQKWHTKYPSEYPAPKRSITLRNEALDKILKPTYGCPIYQEQIMQIFQSMAGYSLGAADVVRRYMSKKKADKLAYEKEAFINGDPSRGIPGCVKLHGVSVEDAENLFEQMMPFAKYGFNKSHAVEYAIVSMYTAYLKYAHTIDFYRCSADAVDKIEDVIPYIDEAKNFGIEFLPPSMGSQNKFSIVPNSNEKQIRYGFSAIKGIGKLNIRERTTRVSKFIRENPNVSLSDIQKLARLGIFTSIFGFAAEQKVINRDDIVKYVNDYGQDIRRLTALKENLTDETLSEDQKKSLLEKKDALAASLNEYYSELKEKVEQAVKNNAPNKKEDIQRIVETEQELIGFMASTKKFMEKFREFDQTKIAGKNFKLLEEQKNGTVRLPVVVVDGGAEKESKTKSGTVFHPVKLMDYTGKIIDRRYKEAIVKTHGWIDVYVDNDRWYVLDESKSNRTAFKPKTYSSPERQQRGASQKPCRATEDGTFLLAQEMIAGIQTLKEDDFEEELE